MPVVTFLAALDGGVNELYVSPQIESLYGIGRAEWLSDTDAWITRVHPGDRTRVRAAYAAHLEAGGAAEDVYRIVAPGGEVRWVHERFSRVEDADGAPMFTFGVIRDVTEERQAQLALRRSEARKTAILDTALDAIITIDHEGKVVEFNPAAERTFGYRRADVLGQRLSQLIIPERYRAAHGQGMRHYLATGIGPVLNRRIELDVTW